MFWTKIQPKHIFSMPGGTHASLWNIDTSFYFVCLVMHISGLRMSPKLRNKITAESPNSRSNAVEAAREGRVPALVEQIENLMNSPVQ